MQVVVSDKATCGGVTHAQQLGIPTLVYPQPKQQLPEGVHVSTDDELIQHLTGALAVDYVLLAGYLKLIPASLIDKYPNRMLNIHPGLLPAFGGKGMYGSRVHEAVIRSGARCASRFPCVELLQYVCTSIGGHACAP